MKLSLLILGFFMPVNVVPLREQATVSQISLWSTHITSTTLNSLFVRFSLFVAARSWYLKCCSCADRRVLLRRIVYYINTIPMDEKYRIIITVLVIY